ncbi:MAG TPA: hypothetical protein VEG30_08705 [Terriglobales bacterium]|nr:hypothetical protein [Terriglobales bacterium]
MGRGRVNGEFDFRLGKTTVTRYEGCLAVDARLIVLFREKHVGRLKILRSMITEGTCQRK